MSPPCKEPRRGSRSQRAKGVLLSSLTFSTTSVIEKERTGTRPTALIRPLQIISNKWDSSSIIYCRIGRTMTPLLFAILLMTLAVFSTNMMIRTILQTIYCDIALSFNTILFWSQFVFDCQRNVVLYYCHFGPSSFIYCQLSDCWYSLLQHTTNT